MPTVQLNPFLCFCITTSPFFPGDLSTLTFYVFVSPYPLHSLYCKSRIIVNKKGPTTISRKKNVGVYVADRKGDQDGIIIHVLYKCRVNAVC